MPSFKISALWKPFWLTLSLSFLIGFAQVSDKLPLAFIGLIGIFLIYVKTTDIQLKRRLFTVCTAITMYMLTVTAWFRNIEAFGWQKISGLPPQFWLILAVFFVSVFCAMIATLVFYFTFKIADTTRLKQAYIWAISMTLMEIIISLSFSLVTRADGASVEPTWNLYSIALLSATNITGNITRFLGLWGTSFLIYCAASFFGLLVVDFFRKQMPAKNIAAPLTILSAVTIFMTVAPLPSRPGETYRMIAVSEPTSDSNYLEKLEHDLQNDLADSNAIKRIVVLPEYSRLLSPYGNSSIISFNYDARYNFQDKFREKPVYFVGTEDQFFEGKRYAETYVTNGRLEKISRKSKDFLIPGGEYVVDWIGGILAMVSKDTAAMLENTRIRNIVKDYLPPEKYDKVADDIGIQACSSMLIPYNFRQQAQEGAGLFAVNVSYEQFKRAPEYERFARRFARLTARATQRPLAVGAYSGSAMILDKKGNMITHTNGTSKLIKADVAIEYGKTPYVILGDARIVLLLSAPLLFMVLKYYLRRYSNVKRTLKNQK